MKFYILNISAIYMYLGESKFMQNRLDDAFDLFSNALNICDEKEDVSSLSIILSKLGIIKYCIGKKNEAMYYLSKSLEYYDKTIFIWGRIQTYYYLSKLYFEREMISQAIEFLDQAMKYSNLFDDNMNDKIKKLRNQINECSNS